MSYTGLPAPIGHDSALQAGIGGGGRFNAWKLDGYVEPDAGSIRLTTSWSAAVAFLHYWTPQLRSGFVATYGQLQYPSGARRSGVYGFVSPGGAYSAAFRDFREFVGLANLVWSPVRNLDIGVEALYQRIETRGRVLDNNRGGALTGRTTGHDDNWLTRFRIDRTF